MELLGVRWIIAAIIFIAMGIYRVAWVSRRYKISLGKLILVIFVINAVAIYLSPVVLQRVGFLHDSDDPKIVQLSEHIGWFSFKEIYADKDNAAIIGLDSHAVVAITTKSLNNTPVEELLWVAYHELGHFYGKDSLREIIVVVLLFFLMVYAHWKYKKNSITQLVMTTILSTVLLLVYFAVCRMFEVRADRYAIAAWYWPQLGAYMSRVVESADPTRNVDRKWFEALRYLHPSLAERIKFLTDK